jgi:2-polyprenyl-6-methoxyphenol hydroxylase-like FAD-dependent oxidoreductase
MTAAEHPIQSVHHTTCCIVGGGPAGVMLALLLGRQGIATTLLEAHPDFDRDFRGDTIHPSTLEILAQLGLADRLRQLPHGRMTGLTLHSGAERLTMATFTRLPTRFPYVMLLPQARFLDFLANEGRRYPSLRIIMGANVQQLVEEDGTVRGVRYHDRDNRWHEVRAELTVGTDGRFSRLRHLAGFTPVKTAPPMDVVWLRLPSRPDDPHDLGSLYVGDGRFCILLEREDGWQVGYVIAKGGYQRLRQAGLDALRQGLVRMVPWLADRVNDITDWQQVSLLAVESSRLPRWYKPGLLLIGDAAHVMSPVGGVGINYAIQDAVTTANLLSDALLEGRVRLADLAEVQRQRVWPTRLIQAIQGLIQKRIVAQALDQTKPFRAPLLFRLLSRLPVLRDLPGRVIGFGIRRVRVRREILDRGERFRAEL